MTRQLFIMYYYFLGDFGFSDGFGMVDMNTMALACPRPFSSAVLSVSSPSGRSSDLGKSGSLDGSLGDERPGMEEVPMETDAPLDGGEEQEFLDRSDFGETAMIPALPTTPVRPALPVLPTVDGNNNFSLKYMLRTRLRGAHV